MHTSVGKRASIFHTSGIDSWTEVVTESLSVGGEV